MNGRAKIALVVFCGVSSFLFAGEAENSKTAIDEVLNSLHQAASDADGDLYFSLFAENAVFLGTDANERWSVDEFKAFAEPYFSQGRGWTYEKTFRSITVAAKGETAWFDEMLWNESYGTCRGTGVVVLSDAGWRVVQYSLSIPIPNDLTRGFATRIKEFQQQPQ